MKQLEPTFAFFVKRLADLYPRLAYLHVIEPRVAGTDDRVQGENESTDFLRDIWKGQHPSDDGSVFLSAGGYTLQSAVEAAERKGELIAFGRHYTSNVRTSKYRNNYADPSDSVRGVA